eukprot:2952007-Pyramimonas_sp.AAC.1
MLCNLRGAFDVLHLRGAKYAAQFTVPNLKLSTPLPAQTSHLPTRNLVCKTHATAIGTSAWRWL